MSKTKYIMKNINILKFDDKQTIAKILIFRDYKILQSNNGVYINIQDIDEKTTDLIYDFMKHKLELI